MTADELRQFLSAREVNFDEKEVQNGWQFKCEGGEIFVAYNTGTVSCQGKPTELSKAVKAHKPTKTPSGAGKKQDIDAPTGANKQVFIVYGHDRPFKERVDEVTGMLFKDLEAAGYKPDSKGL